MNNYTNIFNLLSSASKSLSMPNVHKLCMKAILVLRDTVTHARLEDIGLFVITDERHIFPSEYTEISDGEADKEIDTTGLFIQQVERCGSKLVPDVYKLIDCLQILYDMLSLEKPQTEIEVAKKNTLAILTKLQSHLE